MASSKEYLTYVLELLREVKGISYKKMMGEYILYKDGPYPTAKAMLLVDVEDPEVIDEIVKIIVKN